METMTLNPNVCASTSNRARALVKRHNNSQFLKDLDIQRNLGLLKHFNERFLNYELSDKD